jgi:hypothetical protein
MHMFFKSTLARLDAWAEWGVVPPASLRITLNPDGTPKLDAHGNPEGGVRSSYTDVPTARYFANTGSSQGCSTLGAQERFSPEKLASLYRNHGGYVSSVMHSVKELSRAGWLLPADAQELKNEAPHFAGI